MRISDWSSDVCSSDLKLLAALRGGLKLVLIPKDNEKDLAEIPDNVKRGLKIIPVSTVDEVIGHALTNQPVPIDPATLDADGKAIDSLPANAKSEAVEGFITH